MTPVAPLLAKLFDDAALFPPGNADMRAAVAAYLERAAAPEAALTGPFVCPDSRLAELAAELDGHGPGRFPVSVVVPGGPPALAEALAAAARHPAISVQAVEVPVGTRAEATPAEAPDDGGGRMPAGDGPMPAGGGGMSDELSAVLAAIRDTDMPAGVPIYVEVPAGPGRDAAFDRLAALSFAGLRAKIRTGGTEARAFPDEPTLASALLGCVRRRLPFKLTAGLHHAVRHTDRDTGFEHHGFLNVLVAVAAAQAGAGHRLVTGVLAERNPATLVNAAAVLTDDEQRAVRAAFVSFGTCSIHEPVADLVDLGLLRRKGAPSDGRRPGPSPREHPS